MAIELTADERWDLLEGTVVTGLTTASPDGRSHVVPIRYLADRTGASGDNAKIDHEKLRERRG